MKQARRSPKRKRRTGADREGSGPVAKHLPSRPLRVRSVLPLLLLIGSLVLSCVLVVTGQQTHSMTSDEANHLLRGVHALRTRDFSLSYIHPPLANLINALPVAISGRQAFPAVLQRPPENQRALQELAGDPGLFALANAWLWQHVSNPLVQLGRARRMNLPAFLLPMLVVVALWSRALWGWRGAALSAALVGFTPVTIAMGYFVGNDLASASVAIALLFASFLYWLRPSPWRAALTGALSGAAVATKHPLVALLPVPLIAILGAHLVAAGGAREAPQNILGFRITKDAGVRTLRDVLLAGGTLMLAIWAAFGFSDRLTFTPTLHSWRLAALSPFLPSIFLLGLDRSLADVTGGLGRVSFLLGEAYQGGHWLYFPVTYAVKTPLPELGLVLSGLLLALWQLRQGPWSRRRLAAVATLGLGGLVMGMGLLLSKVNIGFRHALPLLPILGILAGSWARARRRGPGALASVLVLWLLAETVWSHPHELAYCNELAGGTGKCHRYVGNSSVDWGQDLARVAALQQAHSTGPMYLISFPSTPPSFVGLDAYAAVGPQGFQKALAGGAFRWVAVTKTAFLTPGNRREGEAVCDLLGYEPVSFEGKGMWIFEIVPDRRRNPIPADEIQACRARARIVRTKRD